MDLLSAFLAAYISLLVITDPFGMVPVFLSLTNGDETAWRNKQAFKCGLFVFIMLVVFFAAGAWILEFFRISINAVDLGGGLIVAKVGWDLMNPKQATKTSKNVQVEGVAKRDVSFVPLTMPIIAGPGAIAVVVREASKIQHHDGGLPQWLTVGVAILAIAITTFVCFRCAGLLLRALGQGGLKALSRIMGFLLICIAVQMMISGIVGVVMTHFPPHTHAVHSMQATVPQHG